MKRHAVTKLLTVLMVCILITVWNMAFVYGDVIWEPRDSFYEQVREDCHYENRTYFANGVKGYVTAFKSPKSNQIVTDFENGEDVHILFTYEDKEGREWGITEFYDGPHKSGWLPMNELIARYDHITFCEDYEKEFVDYDGSFNPDNYGDKIIVWKYPGSDVISSNLYKEEFKEYLPNFSYMYEDEGGRKWAYFGYFMGREGWVCLTDPENESLPTMKVEYEGLIPASKPERPLVEQNVLWLFIGLVVGVIMVTAVLIKVLYGKKKA